MHSPRFAYIGMNELDMIWNCLVNNFSARIPSCGVNGLWAWDKRRGDTREVIHSISDHLKETLVDVDDIALHKIP